jgi:hypothetical protein
MSSEAERIQKDRRTQLLQFVCSRGGASTINSNCRASKAKLLLSCFFAAAFDANCSRDLISLKRAAQNKARSEQN